MSCSVSIFCLIFLSTITLRAEDQDLGAVQKLIRDGQHREAARILDSLLRSGTGVLRQREINDMLGTVYAAQGDYVSALRCKKRASWIIDSLRRADNDSSLADLARRYEKEKHEQQIALLERQQKLVEADLKQKKDEVTRKSNEASQREHQVQIVENEHHMQSLTLQQKQSELETESLATAKKESELQLLAKERELEKSTAERDALLRNIGIVLIIALALTSLFYLVWRSRRLQRQKIHELRHSVSRDLHDDIGSNLSKIALLSEVMKRNLTESEEDGEDVNTITGSAREAMENMREIVWSMNPDHDSVQSLAAFTRHYGENYCSSHGMRCTFETDVQDQHTAMSSELRRGMFVCVQEVLAFCEGEVVLRFTQKGQTVELSLYNAGQGHGDENTFKGIADRMRAIGGSAEVDSSEGLRVTIRTRVSEQVELGKVDSVAWKS